MSELNGPNNEFYPYKAMSFMVTSAISVRTSFSLTKQFFVSCDV